MAFSLGIISYTISAIVSSIEEVADEIVGADEQESLSTTVVDSNIADDIFEQVTRKTKKPDSSISPETSKTEVKQAENVRTPEIGQVSTESAWVPAPVYGDEEVTEYYLRYSYDLDDIANTRLRSDFGRDASRLIRKSLSESRRRQTESAEESARHLDESKKHEKALRARRKEEPGYPITK